MKPLLYAKDTKKKKQTNVVRIIQFAYFPLFSQF